MLSKIYEQRNCCMKLVTKTYFNASVNLKCSHIAHKKNETTLENISI